MGLGSCAHALPPERTAWHLLPIPPTPLHRNPAQRKPQYLESLRDMYISLQSALRHFRPPPKGWIFHFWPFYHAACDGIMSEYQVTGCGTRLRSPLRSLLRKQRLLVGSLTVNGRITHTHILRVCVMLCVPSNEQHGNPVAGQRVGTQRGRRRRSAPLRSPSRLFLRRRPHTRPARSRALRPYAKRYVARCFPCPAPRWVAVLRSLFRHFACCRPASLGSPASGGAPRPRYRVSPSGRRAARLPPGSLARPVCAALRLRGLSLPPLRFGFPSVRCGLPAVALASLGGAVALRVGSPGPPVLAPFGASGPGPPRPGARRLRRRPVALPPGSLLCSGASPPALFLRRVRFSPAPPRPAAPAGGSGVRVACGLGASVPAASQLPRGWAALFLPCVLPL